MVAGFVGLVLAVIFQEPLIKLRDRFSRWIRNRGRAKRPPSLSGSFSIGGRELAFTLVDGDGRFEYKPDHIRTSIGSTRAVVPPSLAARIPQTTAKQKAEFEQQNWDGRLIRLERFGITRDGQDEDPVLDMRLSLVDYSEFKTIMQNLDAPLDDGEGTYTLREQFITPTRGQTRPQPVPLCANGLGVCMTIVTDDLKTLLGRRSESAGIRPGQLDVAVTEGMHPLKDGVDGRHDMVSPHATVVRGIREELGLEVRREDIHLLGLAVDWDWYQWNIVGSFETRLSAAEVLRSHAMHAQDNFEMEYEVVDWNPSAVFERLAAEPMWAMGMGVLYVSLVRKFGLDLTERAARRFFG